jgi:hypothetical protein
VDNEQSLNYKINNLKNSPTRFRGNWVNDVFAICTEADFQTHLSFYVKNIGKLAMAYDKVVLYVLPTFTFAGQEDSQRPIHTGSRSDAENIFRIILKSQYGFTDDELFQVKFFEELISHLVKRDKRLYVPFATDYQDVWSVYLRDVSGFSLERASVVLNP